MQESFFKFKEVSPTEINPRGWLKNWLDMQARGLTGHIEAAGYPFNGPGWETRNLVEGGQDDWWPFEQTAYWLDGAVRCAGLLHNKALLARVKKQFDYVLAHPDEDGYLGPHFMKAAGNNHRWPHAVFFRALMHYYKLTGDAKIPAAAAKHFKSRTSPHVFHREVCNVEAMLAVFGATDDKELLLLAQDTYKNWVKNNPKNDATPKNLLSSKKPFDHGVSFNEFIKLPVLLYLYTGKKEYLKAAQNGYKKLFKDMSIIDGVCLSAEHLDTVKSALDSHETCDISAQTWALGFMFAATGDVKYADVAELALLNALPGAVNTHTFGGLQYFSAPNQVAAANNSNHNLFHRGQKWMSYRPNPGTECCPGEVNRAIPNYVLKQFLKASDGLAALLYGPQIIKTKINAQAVTVEEKTDYPFASDISFCFKMSRTQEFTFYMRIPCWCKNASLMLNGKACKISLKSGSLAALKRKWADGDKLVLRLPAEIEIHKYFGGVYFKRGPLLYSLKIEEDWKIDKTEKRQSKLLPAYNLYAKSPWNYVIDTKIKPVFTVKKLQKNPWTINSAAGEITVAARKLKNWNIIKAKEAEVGYADWDKRWTVKEKGNFLFTPPLPSRGFIQKNISKETYFIKLVPYGCTHLRLTVLPFK